MCCIFTCCGWMIDLIQRLWTFTMSCIISSAVCCALVTASMSGIALGYNYSLAEYIDLKETNVSVYLKRGVFDDEISDDMDWRRSGRHMPVQGRLNEDNLVNGEQAGPEEMPLRSGRRLDDSLIVSNDQHKFEGSLMRLTARPLDARRHDTPEPVTSDARMEEILAKHPMGSLEQMKAIHSLMNERKSGGERNTVMSVTQTSVSYEIDGRRAVQPPMNPLEYAPFLNDAYETIRKKMMNINPARTALPDEGFREPANWLIPRNQIPESYRRTMDLPNYDLMPNPPLTRPQPIRMTTEVWRPTRLQTQRPIVVQKPRDRLSDQENANVKSKDNKGIFDQPPGPGGFQSESDYEDQAIKGLPVRKKRNRREVLTDTSSHVPSTRLVSDISETIRSITSTLIDKLKSSIEKNDKEFSSITLSRPPIRVETSSPIMISRFVSLH